MIEKYKELHNKYITPNGRIIVGLTVALETAVYVLLIMLMSAM